jgi:hypothetical protein
MTKLVRFRTLLAMAALMVAPAACSKDSDTRHEADRAAERVNDKVEDLNKPREVAEAADHGAGDLVDRDAVGDRDLEGNPAPKSGTYLHDDRVDGADRNENATELQQATAEFEQKRSVRVQTMRSVHAIAASQAMLINAMAEAYPLVEKDRVELNEKQQIFQMRLDEAGNAIQSLELVEPADWEARSDAATKALERAEDARSDAWDALNDADRIHDRTSMR